jgi:hypothetical protein
LLKFDIVKNTYKKDSSQSFGTSYHSQEHIKELSISNILKKADNLRDIEIFIFEHLLIFNCKYESRIEIKKLDQYYRCSCSSIKFGIVRHYLSKG